MPVKADTALSAQLVFLCRYRNPPPPNADGESWQATPQSQVTLASCDLGWTQVVEMYLKDWVQWEGLSTPLVTGHCENLMPLSILGTCHVKAGVGVAVLPIYTWRVHFAT